MSTPDAALHHTIAAGLDYILARQAEDGSWTEWALPPGSSAPWTTAYIGVKLAALPRDLSEPARPSLEEAAEWLSTHAFADGGWGYNLVAGSDADSTAHAILFLASETAAVRRAVVGPSFAAYARLASFQNEDGGFATYVRSGPQYSWNASHPDVTPVALRALLTHPAPDPEAVRRGIDYVWRQQTASGLWNSFWWSTFLYATEANLALLDTLGLEARLPQSLAEVEPGNAFEQALLLSSLLYAQGPGAQERARDLATQLVHRQRRDGSWESAPVLRITRRDCYEPWTCSDAGPLYADPNRLFTTATVLHALARV